MDEEQQEQIDENEIKDNSMENPPPLEENEADLEIDTAGKEFIGTGKKELINLLLKKKKIIIGVVAVAVGLFLILFTATNTPAGVNDYIYLEDLDGKCSNVTVKYEPYSKDESSSSKSMELEEYIKGAVYAYTKDFKDQGEGIYHLYVALANALRTEIIKQDCTIVYHDKKIDTLSSSVRDYKLITKAVDTTKGVIITRKESDELLDIKVSDFCYQNNDGSSYTIYQVPDFKIPVNWVNENVPSRYKDCPCNRPDKSLTSCYIDDNWIHYDDTTGFNVYAALYISNTYHLASENLLSYFVGDYNYRTIIDPNKKKDKDGKSTSNMCSSFDLFNTSLNRSQFVSGLRSYNGTSNSPGLDLFKQNAEKIYDIATSNGINPEFVIVRAISEGFEPGGSTYNYWGVHCTNTGGGKDCYNYNDFDSAILDYCNYLKKTYTDMDDLLRRYAFLGTYWYNPGSWSIGGCAYKDYIFPDGIPDRVVDACKPGNECSTSGGANCVKTTEEEQLYYGKWQNRNMMSSRKEIWGLDENDCSTFQNGQCRIYKQGDPLWTNDILLNSPNGNTLGTAGCALTSVAIAMTCSGKVVDVDNFNPQVLNAALKPYAPDGNYNWTDSNWANVLDSFAPGFHHVKTVSLSEYSNAYDKVSVIEQTKTNTNQLVLWLSNIEHATHFVVYLGRGGGADIQVMDPATGSVETYYGGDFYTIQVFE